MRSEALVIDADGHILEPPDLWEKYLEAKYRPNAIRLKVDDDGYEYLEVAGKPVAQTQRWQLGTLGGMGREIDVATKRRKQFVGAGEGAALPDARAAMGSRDDGREAVGGVLPCLQPMDRRLLPRFRRASRTDCASLAWRPGGSRA